MQDGDGGGGGGGVEAGVQRQGNGQGAQAVQDVRSEQCQRVSCEAFGDTFASLFRTFYTFFFSVVAAWLTARSRRR